MKLNVITYNLSMGEFFKFNSVYIFYSLKIDLLKFTKLSSWKIYCSVKLVVSKNKKENQLYKPVTV